MEAQENPNREEKKLSVHDQVLKASGIEKGGRVKPDLSLVSDDEAKEYAREHNISPAVARSFLARQKMQDTLSSDE